MSDACVTSEELDIEAGVEFVPGALPVVALIDFPYESEKILATIVRGYGQDYRTDITRAEVEHFTGELAKTKLKTPLRFLNSVWLIENVTRAWCNQLTRYGQGTGFVQESLRFSTHNRMQVLLPAGLEGNVEATEAYKHGAREAVRAYHKAIAAGAAVQDARGLAPLNTLTKIFVTVNMQSLCHIYEQRQCCQAQAEEWSVVLDAMKEHIASESELVAGFMQGSWENPDCVSCGFRADFDRPCHRQALFNTNLARLYEQRQPNTEVKGFTPSEA